MMIDVRPRSSRSSACSIRISVGRSMFDVASSRIRMRGSASSARAIEISWRSPAESPAPPSRTVVQQALVEAPCDAVDADRARDVRDLVVGRLGAREADVVGDRPREQERILEHDAELPAVRAQLERRAGRARRRGSRRRPGRRSGRRASRSSTCRRRTAPTSARQPPAGTWMSIAVQHRLLAVRERDVVEVAGRPRSGRPASRRARRGSPARRRGRARSSPSPRPPTAPGRRDRTAPAAAGRRG